jgi:hypothetical protein
MYGSAVWFLISKVAAVTSREWTLFTWRTVMAGELGKAMTKKDMVKTTMTITAAPTKMRFVAIPQRRKPAVKKINPNQFDPFATLRMRSEDSGREKLPPAFYYLGTELVIVPLSTS